MSARRRLLRLTAAAAGTLAAGVVAGALAEKRLVAGRRQVIGEEGFGRLHSTPVSVVADDGVCLHAEVDEPDEPDAAEPTLVFVHGYALNLDCWHFQREHFRGRYRTVFYDQRSHGRSDRSAKENATIDQLGHDLRAVLDQLVPDGPVVLVGHSMGGMTIMALADHYPDLFGEQVVGAALISTTAGGLRTHSRLRWLPERVMGQVTPRLVAGLARAPGLVDSARRAGSDIGFLATERLAFGDEVPDSYVEFVDAMLAQTPFDVLAEFFPNFGALDKYSVLHAFEKVPTAIICGDRDRLTSVGLSRKMASLIDGARLVECPGAGHLVILERRAEVGAALERLVDAAADEEQAS